MAWSWVKKDVQKEMRTFAAPASMREKPFRFWDGRCLYTWEHTRRYEQHLEALRLGLLDKGTGEGHK